MNRCKYVLVICMLIISQSLTTHANSADDNIVYKGDSYFNEQFKSFTQLNFSCSYRSDERSSLSHSPTIRTTFYSLFSKYVGIKIGIGLNFNTSRTILFDNSIERVKEFQLESGFRFQNQMKTLAPFAEAGFIYISYDGLSNERDNDKNGIFVVLGAEYLVVNKIGIELSFRQIFNNTSSYVLVTPPIEEGNLFYNPPDNDPFFNPTSFNLGINLKFK